MDETQHLALVRASRRQILGRQQVDKLPEEPQVWGFREKQVHPRKVCIWKLQIPLQQRQLRTTYDEPNIEDDDYKIYQRRQARGAMSGSSSGVSDTAHERSALLRLIFHAISITVPPFGKTPGRPSSGITSAKIKVTSCTVSRLREHAFL